MLNSSVDCKETLIPEILHDGYGHGSHHLAIPGERWCDALLVAEEHNAEIACISTVS